MSRSRRKNPFCSITVSGFNRGEKDEKRLINRKVRRKNRSMISIDVETSNEIIFIDKAREIHEVWDMRKDGKKRFDPNSFHGKILMRK